MKRKINNIVKNINTMNLNVIEVTKDHYTLENGDTFEHTFEIDENITVDEFQKLLDNAKSMMKEVLNKIEKEEL